MTTAQKLERTLRGKGYEGVSCTEWRKSIRLEGELDDWKAIVKAGKIAAKAGYKGVINDITLKGFTPPPIRTPKQRDNALEGRRPDVLIIGGTSLAVYPAAGLIDYYRGNKLVLVNKSATPMDARANLLVQGSIGEIFTKIEV